MEASSSPLLFDVALWPPDAQARISFQTLPALPVSLTRFSGLCVDRPDSCFLFLFSLIVWGWAESHRLPAPPQPLSAQLLRLCFSFRLFKKPTLPGSRISSVPEGHGLVPQNKLCAFN